MSVFTVLPKPYTLFLLPPLPHTPLPLQTRSDALFGPNSSFVFTLFLRAVPVRPLQFQPLATRVSTDL
jgi:hypothetical protein